MYSHFAPKVVKNRGENELKNWCFCNTSNSASVSNRMFYCDKKGGTFGREKHFVRYLLKWSVKKCGQQWWEKTRCIWLQMATTKSWTLNNHFSSWGWRGERKNSPWILLKKALFRYFQLARGKTTRQTIRRSPRNPVWSLRTSNAVHSKLFLRWVFCLLTRFVLRVQLNYCYWSLSAKYIRIVQSKSKLLVCNKS